MTVLAASDIEGEGTGEGLERTALSAACPRSDAAAARSAA